MFSSFLNTYGTGTYWNRYVINFVGKKNSPQTFIHLCKFLRFLDRFGIFGLAGSVQSRNNRSETESELTDIKFYTIDVIFG
jgi:hypothetical protein